MFVSCQPVVTPTLHPSFGHRELEAHDQRAAHRRGCYLAGVDWGVARQQTHGEPGSEATQQHHGQIRSLSHGGTPQRAGLEKSHQKMDDLGVPPFQETSVWI